MKQFSFLLSIVLCGLMALLASCSNDGLIAEISEPETEVCHSIKVNMNIRCEGFSLEGGARRVASQDGGTSSGASYTWKDGDVVYLLLTDKNGAKVQAYVKYNGTTKEWGDVIYDGYKSYLTCTTKRPVEAYFLEGVNAVNATNLSVSNAKAIYACTNASYVYPSSGDMTINDVVLKPLTGRIRFEGTTGKTATVSGIKTFTSFSTATGQFTESTTGVTLTVDKNGSTPYLYCLFVSTTEPSLEVTTDKTYKTIFDPSSSILQPGKSGYMSLPTADDHRGWMTIVSVTGVSITPTTLSLNKGKSATLTAKVLPEDATEKSLTWTSSNSAVATVDNTGKVTGVSGGTATITATSVMDGSKKATCTVTVADANGHAYVDLGLTSGTLWATMNVGATSPSDYGSYFAWGETTTKSTYTSSNYTYSSNPSTLPIDKDAARVNWGGAWKMPTKAQFSELKSECTWTWSTLSGNYGYTVSSKKNSNYIFLPAAGSKGTSVSSAASSGFYWSSELYSTNSTYAYYLYFISTNIDPLEWYQRYVGRSVRPVLSK